MDTSVKRKLLHLFFPNRCPVCRKVIYADDRFCPECESKLTLFSGRFSISGAESFTAVYEYDEKVSPAVFLMKNGICGNAAFALGAALADKLKADGITENTDIILPVPMYRKDEHKRGFNQSELICREAGRILGIPVNKSCMVKTVSTASQKSLGKEERQQNLRGVFRIADTAAVKGKNVLVIDDVCTTGSTLAEITDVLLKSGASSVRCAACCKTAKKDT